MMEKRFDYIITYISYIFFDYNIFFLTYENIYGSFVMIRLRSNSLFQFKDLELGNDCDEMENLVYQIDVY